MAKSFITCDLKFPLNFMMILQAKLCSKLQFTIKSGNWGAWLAQLVEHATLNLGVIGLSPHVGCRDFI